MPLITHLVRQESLQWQDFQGAIWGHGNWNISHGRTVLVSTFTNSHLLSLGPTHLVPALGSPN